MIKNKLKIHSEKCGSMRVCGCTIQCTAKHGLTRGDDKGEWTDKHYSNLNDGITIRGACPAWGVGKFPISHYNIFEGWSTW